jgi:hypothetical protein
MRFFGVVTPHELLIAAVVAVPTMVVISVRSRLVRDTRRREEARRCAADVAVALAASIQICERLWAALQNLRVTDETIYEGLSAAHAQRQRLRGFLREQIPLGELIPIAVAAERQLSAACEVMSVLRQPSNAVVAAIFQLGYDPRLDAAQAPLASIVNRLRRLQPDLAQAVAKVDGGWGTRRRAAKPSRKPQAAPRRRPLWGRRPPPIRAPASGASESPG